jgi:aminomethyltransferase
MADSPNEILLETPLAAEHRALGARMVPFGGYAMPVQYPSGIIAEHKWTREHAGLFDVSHMGPSFLMLVAKSGEAEKDHAAVAALIEPLVTGEVRALKPGQVRYTLMTNGDGGIIDDLMVARSARIEHSGTLYIVVNAGTKDGDFEIIAKAVGERAELHRADDGGLLALQGPEAAAVMRDFMPAACDLGFMTYGSYEWQGGRLMISRSGYTGEDGFEILVRREDAVTLWRRLLEDPRVRPIGLGARDSLRLEAGLPLNGHDLDGTTSPVEANLAFAVSKRRRSEGSFPGAARVMKELADGTKRLRVGIAPEGKAPVREGAAINDIVTGRQIGVITSGSFGPTMNAPVAMGHVETAFATPGTKLAVDVRGRALPASVAELPFVPHRYHRKPS